MHVNVRLSEKYKLYAVKLRELYFGQGATEDEYNNSMVFERAIDSFSDDPVMLRQYVRVKGSQETLSQQNQFRIRQSTYDKLRSLSKALDCSIPAAFRAVILYSVFDCSPQDQNSCQALPMREIEGELRLLSHQLQECQSALSEILKKVQMRN